MSYTPKPIEADEIVLPAELMALTEALAENTHELWARERLAQGWTHGTTRDDVQKQHPSLVPYGQLGDDERRFDRITALGTLRAILALGYRIVPPEP